MELALRRARPQDAAALARLSGELGYPATSTRIRTRLRGLARNLDYRVTVACLGKRVVGWVLAGQLLGLSTDPRTLVIGLVVDSRVRGHGIGRALMHDVEAWTRKRGVGSLRLTSQTKRSEAHRFYEGLGYKLTKTSHVFEKRLGR